MRKCCPLNHCMFNLLITKLKQEMRKEDLRLAGGKIYTFAYTNNVVISREKGRMKSIYNLKKKCI